jgi:hypothetical protein
VKRYWWLLVTIFAVLGICTLVPVPAGKPSLLGYHSLRPHWLSGRRAAKEAAAPKGEAPTKGGA